MGRLTEARLSYLKALELDPNFGGAMVDLAEAESLQSAPLAEAVLRLHADRVQLAAREERLLARFTRAHPEVALAKVPALAGDVHDLDGLRDIGVKLAG